MRRTDFVPWALWFFPRMITQGGKRIPLSKQLKKAFQWQQGLFQKYGGFHRETTLKTLRTTKSGLSEHAGVLIKLNYRSSRPECVL